MEPNKLQTPNEEQKGLETPTEPVTEIPKAGSGSRLRLVLVVSVAVILTASITWLLFGRKKSETPVTNTGSQQNNSQEKVVTQVQGLQLDPGKNYGVKYANGILPVGDNQYSTSGGQKGKIYLCNANSLVEASKAGAQTRGPWFIGTTQWNINKKTSVSGKVNWTPRMTNSVSGNIRTISTNDLPNHFTGIFPVKSDDPAYAYDRNPNSISEQDLTYTLNAKPTYGAPQCMTGEVGIMLTGVSLFNGFDAGGRDAGAWEVQDGCNGHPQNHGQYHYHTLSRCVTDQSVSTVLGFALDGFPITGPKVGEHNILTTSDLDECHGITSEIILDGAKVTTYHYVMTQDFPYSVGCFRSTANRPPGQAENVGNNPNQAPPPPRR